jgi:membrane fusion protein (multidrug efflux system)
LPPSAAAVAVAGIGYGSYWYLVASHYVSTDNAYVSAETVQITPAINGTIRDVKVVDTQSVRKGDVLVVIDDTDARLALEQAEAELARAERRFQGAQATDQGLQAQVAAREADQKRAAAQLASAKADFERAKLDLAAARNWRNPAPSPVRNSRMLGQHSPLPRPT